MILALSSPRVRNANQRLSAMATRQQSDVGLNTGSLGASMAMTRLSRLVPYKRNARTHSKKQIRQIADSIERFGFTNPILVDDNEMILAGHGRAAAAKLLGMDMVP